MFRLLFLILIIIPFGSEAQYKLRKEQKGQAQTLVPVDYSIYEKYQKGEFVLDGGFATTGRGVGLIYYGRGEYFITEKISTRLNFFINSFLPNPEPQSYLQIVADGTFHFYQEKRFDVYTFLGVGFHRFRSELNSGVFTNSITPTINSGVGGRYRITPTFGLQLEFGRTSTIGIYKSLKFLQEE